MSRSRVRSSVQALVAALAIAASAQGIEAQTGTISGIVIDAQTLQPLSAVQVFEAGANIGALTGNNGRYSMTNVPAGVHTVTASRIGYRTEEQQVTVDAGGTVTVDFSLAGAALELDALVVTGTPGGTQVRAIGNVVGRVDAARVTEIAPIRSMQELLTGREPGLTFYGSDGSVGTGRTIRIRGLSSLSMNAQPLIYVDGIRVDNDAAVGPTQLRAQRASRLNDFNSDDIASIEIIKGPAAATLYGTEASAGVIQIITKKGESGQAQFDLTVRQGANWLMRPRWKVGNGYGLDENGELIWFNIVQQEVDRGTPVFTTGHAQGYNLAMRGGTDLVRYFLSADWQKDVGMTFRNWENRTSLRANVNVVPADNWTIDVSAGFVDGMASFASATMYDLWYSVHMSQVTTVDTRDRGFFRSPPEVQETLSATREFKRFTGSATVTYNAFPWLTQRLIMGTDQTNDRNIFLAPRQIEPEGHWYGGLAYGEKNVRLPITSTNTLDYSASARYSLSPTIGFVSSVGLQYYNERAESVTSSGEVFPSPVITALSGLATVTTTDEFDENTSVGVYFQQEFNWRERVFLTAAVRGDDNSAFGSGYDAAIYPKFSGTWVVTDEDFWQWGDWVNSLRVRSAWGQAGRQPSSFAAVTLYAPTVAMEGQSAIEPTTLGNADVGPEVSSELELGFDIAGLNDRVSAEFTWYDRTVTDALVNVPVASSGGFPGTQDQNLGELSNWGWELRLDGRPIEGETFTLDLGASYSEWDNRIDDMGGVPQTTVLREGHQFPSAWYTTPDLQSGTLDEDGFPVGILCDYGVNVVDGYGFRGGEWKPCVGGPEAPPRLYWGPLGTPRNEASADVTLGIGQSLSLYAMAEYRGYVRVEGNDNLCRFSCYTNDRFAVERQIPSIICAVDSANFCGGGNSTRLIHGGNGEFAKLREVSMTYRLPEGLSARVGVSNASITLAGRDLFTWQAQQCMPDEHDFPEYDACYGGTSISDPETRDQSQALSGGNATGSGVSGLPGLSSFTATMRVSF